MTAKLLLGVDTGGTFTDFILIRNGQIALHKVLSTPRAPEEAIIQGIEELGLKNQLDQLRVVHGTTVATNAALESKGVKTAYITNRGFKDVLTIGRQAREELYNLQPEVKPPPVPEDFCLETGGRVDAQGQILDPLTEPDLDELEHQIRQLQPEAVAINLLFSYLNDSNEKRIQDRLKKLAYTCRSSEVLPEMKEYERGIATWYNAYLGPLVDSYMHRLKSALEPAPMSIMQSSGGTISLDQAASKAARLLLSGPAGGLAAGIYLGEKTGSEKLLSFDMGGTSTDVAMLDGDIRLTSEGKIGRYPIALPMVDMHTIGAGGGSIAYLDAAGMLHVGPESAGANPGPACYGQGGSQPTVTDANVVLGRLQPDSFLGGRMSLDRISAIMATENLSDRLNIGVEECALGILDLANEHMTQALRVISEQRGHDPSEYRLLGFGGAGGLHICAMAQAIGIHKAMVPIYGGVFSAFGMLVAPQARELSLSHMSLLNQADTAEINTLYDRMAQKAVDELLQEGAEEDSIHIERTMDCRYKGQSFTLNIPWHEKSKTAKAFHQLHKKTYGHNFDLAIEIVNLRISARVNSEAIELPEIRSIEENAKQMDVRPIWARNTSGKPEQMAAQIFQRNDLKPNTWVSGPALVCETSATTWIEPGWRCMRDLYGNLLLEKTFVKSA